MHKFKIKKGFFLVFTLLLTVLVTSACLVMVQTATLNKSSSSSQISGETLQNLASQYTKAIARTLDASITGSFMSDLVNNKANIFLADLSGGLPPVIVCNVTTSTTAAFACTASISTANPKSIPTSSGIASQFLSANKQALNISPKGTPTANANVMSIDPKLSVTIDVIQNSYYNTGAIANYNLTINTRVCSDPTTCKDSNTTQIFTRSCPNAGKSLDSPSKSMRALTDAEIKALGSGQYTYSNAFPNLYCTCPPDTGFGKTKSDGTCAVSCSAGQYVSGSSCLPCSATAGCATCTTSATNCTSCKANYNYDSSSNTCTCPSGFYKDSLGNCNACNLSICATCSGNATNCTSCSGSKELKNGTCSSCTGSTYFDNNTRTCRACDSNCATCSGSATNCTSCSGSKELKNGTCSSCTGSTYFDNNTRTCQPCDSSCATCSGGGSNQCLTCRSGSPVNGTCPSCTGGSVPGGGGVSTGVSNCACPDRTYYWNGSSCIVCPAYSVGSGWSYGPSTPIGTCKCVDSQAVWVSKFQICAFPCYDYDTGPYLCNAQTGSPTYGYFCAYCNGSNCVGHSWMTTQNIGISQCTYCPAGHGNC